MILRAEVSERDSMGMRGIGQYGRIDRGIGKDEERAIQKQERGQAEGLHQGEALHSGQENQEKTERMTESIQSCFFTLPALSFQPREPSGEPSLRLSP